jgi:hypothetical protein
MTNALHNRNGPLWLRVEWQRRIEAASQAAQCAARMTSGRNLDRNIMFLMKISPCYAYLSLNKETAHMLSWKFSQPTGSYVAKTMIKSAK